MQVFFINFKLFGGNFLFKYKRQIRKLNKKFMNLISLFFLKENFNFNCKFNCSIVKMKSQAVTFHKFNDFIVNGQWRFCATFIAIKTFFYLL